MTEPLDDAQRLAQAEAAYHDLMLTGGTQTLRHGDKTIEYGRQDAPRLAAYIRDLRGRMGLPGGRARARRIAF